MKNASKFLLILLLIAAFASFVTVLTGTPVKWLNTSGIFLEIAGIVQLSISGFFEHLMTTYSDEEKYPYGPPSNVTRVIIDNPDTPLRTGARNLFFYDTRMGAGLIIAGLLLQLTANWV